MQDGEVSIESRCMSIRHKVIIKINGSNEDVDIVLFIALDREEHKWEFILLFFSIF